MLSLFNKRLCVKIRWIASAPLGEAIQPVEWPVYAEICGTVKRFFSEYQHYFIFSFMENAVINTDLQNKCGKNFTKKR
jgi:hypothetical protein